MGLVKHCVQPGDKVDTDKGPATVLAPLFSEVSAGKGQEPIQIPVDLYRVEYEDVAHGVEVLTPGQFEKVEPAPAPKAEEAPKTQK